MDKTIKAMRKEIQDWVESSPDEQIAVGRFMQKIGTRYVYILDIWDEVSIEKVAIGEFYADHFLDY